MANLLDDIVRSLQQCRQRWLNISKKDKNIRRCFITPEGKRLIALDYAAIEARMLAFITGDPKFIEAVLSGNLHDVNTKTLFHIDENDRHWKAGRAASKIFQFGFVNIGRSLNPVNCWNAKEGTPSMPISSQALWEHNEGSTTNAWSPERAVKRHERGKVA